VSVAIPTFDRGRILVETIEHLLRQQPHPEEVLIVDQTPRHADAVEMRLSGWAADGSIRRVRLARPSITRAMNAALVAAAAEVVLFVDDDIVPLPGLVGAHERAYADSQDIWAVTGQVLQPGETPLESAPPHTRDGLRACLDFSFRSTRRAWVRSVMAGNLSVRRTQALEIGGFDENFVGAAYRFETEFCRRVWRHGGKVLYEPVAAVRHLRAARGGIRRFGCHLCSPSAVHGVGDYYFALRHGVCFESLAYMFRRPLREVCTRFHLRRPWCIPVKLIGECAAAAWAVALAARGPRLLRRGALGGPVERE